MPHIATAVMVWSKWMTIGKDRLNYSLNNSQQVFCLLFFAPPIPVILRRFRWLPSNCVLDPLEGLPVFLIWRECIGHGLEIPSWQQKKRHGNTIF